MSVNISAGTEVANVVPELRFPGVGGIRVEANGQVLLRGGDLAAGRRQDTTSERRSSSSKWVGGRVGGWVGVMSRRGREGTDCRSSATA